MSWSPVKILKKVNSSVFQEEGVSWLEYYYGEGPIPCCHPPKLQSMAIWLKETPLITSDRSDYMEWGSFQITSSQAIKGFKVTKLVLWIIPRNGPIASEATGAETWLNRTFSQEDSWNGFHKMKNHYTHKNGRSVEYMSPFPVFVVIG